MASSSADREHTKPLKKRKAIELASTSSFSNIKPGIDLQEWIGSLVLARYGSGCSVYRPGKILSCPSSGSVRVLLDKQTDTITYSNVFDSLEILGNFSPAANLVSQGSTVCVKEKTDDNLFVVAKVKQLEAGPPLRFLVESENLPSDVWVNRANIRLMQPPWHDDLMEAGVSQPVSTTNCANFYTVKLLFPEILPHWS